MHVEDRVESGPDDDQVAAVEAMTRVLVRLAWNSAHAAPHGVTFSQFRALLTLYELGTVPSSRLAAALEINASSVTRLADRLAERGYLVRGQQAGNRGVVTLALTDSGSDVVTSVLDLRHTALRTVLDGLPAQWRERFAGDALRFAESARVVGIGQVERGWPL